MRALRWCSLALALGGCAPSAADAPIDEQWAAVAVEAAPIELGTERAGDLVFRGGLVLTSDDERFGGWSGMEVLQDGRLIAISDAGLWLSAQIVLDANGGLVGVSDARIAQMRDETGEPFANKASGDAEDLAQLPDGRFAVSFEQTQSIRLYDFNRDGPFGAALAGPLLGDVARLPSNAGLEAIAATEQGALIVGAEDRGLLWRARPEEPGPVARRAHYPLEFGYALTSLDRLPEGELVALERFYAPVIGARARITVVSLGSLDSANVQARTTVLADLAPPLVVDNFEAITALRNADGTTRLYILSDDNYNPRQRTLLYAFDISPPAPAAD
ncbi:MAG: esterase-like activity of phytase family protein [Hyphomonadaceae bacterium]